MTPRLEQVYRKFGLRIRRIRTHLGWTQEKLAVKINLERTSVVNMEAGRQRVQLHQVKKYASALKTTPQRLVKGIWF